jgi:hypothetical protein
MNKKRMRVLTVRVKWRNMCKSLESWTPCSSILFLFRYLEMTATLAFEKPLYMDITFWYRRQKFNSQLRNCPWVMNMTPREIFMRDPCPYWCLYFKWFICQLLACMRLSASCRQVLSLMCIFRIGSLCLVSLFVYFTCL